LYAVKSNPEPSALQSVWEGGVRHFDCASLSEIELIRSLFGATNDDVHIHLMHPIKSRVTIRKAYLTHGVRDYVIDSVDELEKIMQETSHATGV
jgi:ornithine decarboxylase